MHKIIQQTENIDFKVDKIARPFDIHNSSNFTSKNPVSFSSTTTNRVIETNFLSKRNNFEQKFENRITMVDRKSQIIKWPVNHTITSPSGINPDRCITNRLGSCLQRLDNRRSLVEQGTGVPYQCARIISSQICSPQFYKNRGNKIYSLSDRQHSCINLPDENGGHSKQTSVTDFQRNLDIFNTKWDHDYSRIPPKQTKLHSRQGISQKGGFDRVETVPTVVQNSLPKIRDSTDGPVCFEDLPSNPQIFCLETRSSQSGNKCNVTNLVSETSICFPSLLNDNECPTQSAKGQCGEINFDNSILAKSALVPISPPIVNKKTSSLISEEKPFDKSKGGIAPYVREPNINSSGMGGYRQKLSKEGISERAANLIAKARRPGSLSNYESSWKKWSSWCAKREIDPFRCHINKILDYLSDLFHEGFEYRTIGCHRSAISAFHEHVDGKPVGQNPLICSLMTGIFNSRPPQPRYSCVWDVQLVLDFIKKSWGNTDKISCKELTYKLVALMALTSASRVSGLHHLDIRYMSKINNNYIFKFHKLHKSWKKGECPPSLEFYSYQVDSEMCVVSTLDEYLSRSQNWRKESGNNQLLLSFIKPHREVLSSTISGWIKKILSLSGINTNIFKAHSTRSASTSKAGLHGLSLSDILEQGSWSNSTTWQKFYHKNVESAGEKFQNCVLNNKKLKTL